MKVGRVARLIVLALIAAAETALLIYLAWTGRFDEQFLTYINKFVTVVLLWFLLISNVDYLLFQWAVSLVLPFMTGCAVVIGIGVTALVYLRPMIYIRDLQVPLDEDNVAFVHTGDWLLHQLPLFESIIIAFCVYREMSCAIRYTMGKYLPDGVQRFFFITFACVAHVIFIMLYCIICPFVDVYLLDDIRGDAYIPIGALALISAVSVLIVYFIYFHVVEMHSQAAYAGHTLMVNARPSLKRDIETYIGQQQRPADAAIVTEIR
jgi:hypothetical protein